jgi:hypothetical protein
MFEGLEGLLGKLYKGDDQGAQQQQEPTFLANLTGVPNTDSRGQGFALAAALAGAGSAISNANRPSYHGAPSMGNLLSAGAGGFINGLGVQAMLRQKAAIDQAKAKMAEMQMKSMEQEQSGWEELNRVRQEGNGMPSPDLLKSLALLPGPAGNSARQMLQIMQDNEYRQQQLGLQRDANARAWAAQKAGSWSLSSVDDGYGNKVPVYVNSKTREMVAVNPSEIFSQSSGGGIPGAAPAASPDPQSFTEPFSWARGQSPAGNEKPTGSRIYNYNGEEVPFDPRMRFDKVEDVTLPDGRKASIQRDQSGRFYREFGPPKKGGAGDDLKRDQGNVVLGNIGRAKELAHDYVLFPNTGLAMAAPWGWLNSIAGSPANDLAKTLDSVKANIGFDKLQEMRANSPTGGALGSVSNEENTLLQSTIASLDQSQSKEQFLRNLQEVENRYLDIVHGKGNWTRDRDGQVLVGIGIEQGGSESQIKRQSSSRRLRYNPETGDFD